MNIPHLARRLNRAASSLLRTLGRDPIVALNFHQVIEPSSSANLLCVSEKCFDEQMAVLARDFEVIPLDDIVSGKAYEPRKKGQKSKRRAVITFDDGYWDTYQNALPILEKYGLPAAVFITTGTVGNAAPFWWDELESLLINRIPTGADLTPLQANYPQMPKALSDGFVRRRLFHDLSTWFKASRPDRIEQTMKYLRGLTSTPHPEEERNAKRTVTEDELDRLAASKLIHIGSHTVNHFSLGTLTADEQRHQLSESKKYLEKRLNRKIDTIAYPFGGPLDYNGDTISVAKELGYRIGMTTEPGLLVRSRCNYQLPRFFVHNWRGEEFGRKLSRFYWIAG